MQTPTNEARQRNIIIKGLKHLFDGHAYGQINVLNKFETLGYSLTASVLSKIKTGREVGAKTLSHASKHMEEVLRLEMDMAYRLEIEDFEKQNTPNWAATIIPESEEKAANKAPFLLHVNGRVSIQEKTQFISSAQKNVLEIGVRLNSYTSYFISQSEKAFKAHILTLLRKGVHIKSYLLDPDTNEARIYFEDRAKVQSFEKDAIVETKRNLERLRALCQEFEEMKLDGSFEVFLYKHIPFSQILVVDSEEMDAKMMVSHYLYGVKRANCPVIEFTRKEQSLLFNKYWESFQHFTDKAEKLK